MLTSHEKNFSTQERSKDPANNAGHVEFMKSLPLKWKQLQDGNYELIITTDRGERVVDYTCSTGQWKVRNGKGEGFGIPKMARYFHIGGFPKDQQPTFDNKPNFNNHMRDFNG